MNFGKEGGPAKSAQFCSWTEPKTKKVRAAYRCTRMYRLFHSFVEARA